MKKSIITSLFVFLPLFIFAQDSYKRWNSFADLNFIIPGDIEYHLEKSPLPIYLDHSFTYGLNYSYEYSLFRKFSIGGVTGVTLLAEPTLPTLKYGLIFRFTFVQEYKANIYFHTAGYLPLNNRTRADFGELRLGLNFPISRGEKYSLTAGIFLTAVSNQLAKPLMESTKDPDRVRYNGTGFSVGLRF